MRRLFGDSSNLDSIANLNGITVMKPLSSALLLAALLAAATLSGCKDRNINTPPPASDMTPAPVTTPVPAPEPAPAAPSATPPDNGTTTAPPVSPAPATTPPSSGTSGTSGTSGSGSSGTDAYGKPVTPGTRNDNADAMPRKDVPPQR